MQLLALRVVLGSEFAVALWLEGLRRWYNGGLYNQYLNGELGTYTQEQDTQDRWKTLRFVIGRLLSDMEYKWRLDGQKGDED